MPKQKSKPLASNFILAAALLLLGLSPLRLLASSSYENGLEEIIDSLLIGLGHSGIEHLAVAQFREQSSSQRSAFCAKLEQDLTQRLHVETDLQVPDYAQNQQVLGQMAGANTNLDYADMLYHYGKALGVQAVLTGSYQVQGDQLVVNARLLRCEDGTEAWHKQVLIHAADLGQIDLSPVPGTQALGSLMVLTPSPQQTPLPLPPATPQAASLSPTSLPAWGAFQAGLGYQHLMPQNSVFASAVGSLNAVVATLCWADLFTAEWDYWYTGPLNITHVNSLTGYAGSLSLSWPWRLTPYGLVYLGAGGRFETIQVNNNLFPSQYPISFGNNSVFAILGFKFQTRYLGLDFNFSQDLWANDNTNFIFKTGLFYEFNFSASPEQAPAPSPQEQKPWWK